MEALQEAIDFRDITDGSTALRVVGDWIGLDNPNRPLSGLGGLTSDEPHGGETELIKVVCVSTLV